MAKQILSSTISSLTRWTVASCFTAVIADQSKVCHSQGIDVHIFLLKETGDDSIVLSSGF